MKFYFEDILNFISEEPTKDDLSKKLFQLGHEHEINGSVFDMEITPNRGDCLSLLGLSRDLYNFYDIKDPFNSYDREIEVLDINFKNLSADVCPKISFLEIEIDEHASSYKPYLENYFSKLGNKKTNLPKNGRNITKTQNTTKPINKTIKQAKYVVTKQSNEQNILLV